MVLINLDFTFLTFSKQWQSVTLIYQQFQIIFHYLVDTLNVICINLWFNWQERPSCKISITLLTKLKCTKGGIISTWSTIQETEPEDFLLRYFLNAADQIKAYRR